MEKTKLIPIDHVADRVFLCSLCEIFVVCAPVNSIRSDRCGVPCASGFGRVLVHPMREDQLITITSTFMSILYTYVPHVHTSNRTTQYGETECPERRALVLQARVCHFPFFILFRVMSDRSASYIVHSNVNMQATLQKTSERGARTDCVSGHHHHHQSKEQLQQTCFRYVRTIAHDPRKTAHNGATPVPATRFFFNGSFRQRTG